MKVLYFIRGVSGSGKSTFARTLALALTKVQGADKVHHVEADHYRYDENGVYVYRPEDSQRVHGLCKANVKYFMDMQAESIIVSNTSTRRRDVRRYKALADANGYKFVSLVVENYHQSGNIHGVDEETLDRMTHQLMESIKLS